MPALPNNTEFTGGAVTEGGFKTAIAGLRDYLSGLFGATGTPADARLALGVLTDVPEVSVVAATSTNIGAAPSSNLLVTGSTAITSFGTVAAGTVRHLRFSGAPLLSHNSISLILPSAANIQVAAGDCLEAESLGGGSWVVRSYTRANGMAVISPQVPVVSVNGMTGAVTIADPTTAQVTAATAGLTLGGVGTYAFLAHLTSGTQPAPGSTFASTSLRFSSGTGEAVAGSPLPVGTWRCLGMTDYSVATARATLWLRIA